VNEPAKTTLFDGGTDKVGRLAAAKVVASHPGRRGAPAPERPGPGRAEQHAAGDTL